MLNHELLLSGNKSLAKVGDLFGCTGYIIRRNGDVKFDALCRIEHANEPL